MTSESRAWERPDGTDEDREWALAEKATEPFECIECRVPVEDGECPDPVVATCREHRAGSVALPLRCLVCDTQPDVAIRDAPGSSWQPYGATVFTTTGHYGSTVFDEITGGRELALVVCDPCLRERCGRLAVMTTYTVAQQLSRPWDPSEEDDR